MQCTDCLCTPCIVISNYVKMGNGQRPSSKNPGIRKLLYRKFWGCLANLGIWKQPCYIERKRANKKGVITKREIMPACIVKYLRELYPNPVGVSYMGHKWEWIRRNKERSEISYMFSSLILSLVWTLAGIISKYIHFAAFRSRSRFNSRAAKYN